MYNLCYPIPIYSHTFQTLGSDFFVGASFCSNFIVDCDINSTTVEVFFCFFCGWVWSPTLVCTQFGAMCCVRICGYTQVQANVYTIVR